MMDVCCFHCGKGPTNCRINGRDCHYPCFEESITRPGMTDETWEGEKIIAQRKHRGATEYLKTTDSAYRAFSGYKVILTREQLFGHKQLKGYYSVEQARIEWGLRTTKGEERKQWIDKAKSWNATISPKHP